MDSPICNIDAIIEKMKAMEAQALDAHVASGLICVHSHIITNAPLEPVLLKGGWKICFTNYKGPKAPRTAYLASTDPRTFILWQAGQLEKREREGMTRAQALRWLDVRDPIRFECLEYLHEVVNSEQLTNAYLQIVPGMSRREIAKWKHANKTYDPMSNRYRVRFCNILRAVIGEEQLDSGK